MAPNLHALDKFFVQPTTSTDTKERNKIPDSVLKTIGVPEAPDKTCCYAQLLNPRGLEVDYFVSHCWDHEFERTVAALSNFAEGVYRGLGKKSADDVVFWVCLFALNQHHKREEVGSSPEEGPFNVALAKAKEGAVMILDGSAEPMRRIWCLYEVSRAEHFKKDFKLINDDGDLSKADIGIIDEISKSLIKLRASEANASNVNDKNAIHYRILDPAAKNLIGSFEHFKKEWASKKVEGAFVEFDRRVCQLIATPLFTAGMSANSKDISMRAIGMGAEVTVANLEALKHRHNIDMKAVRVKSRDGNMGLAHLFAISGREDLLKYVLDCGVNIRGKDDKAFTPFHYATKLGHMNVCELLIKGGAEIDAKAHGMTPLLGAALYGQLDICELLVKGGAKIDAEGMVEPTALDFAAQIGHLDICKLLIKGGANVDGGKAESSNPLVYAAFGGYLDICELLLNCGAAINKKVPGGTAFDAALENGQTEVSKFLRAHGAKGKSEL